MISRRNFVKIAGAFPLLSASEVVAGKGSEEKGGGYLEHNQLK